MGYSEQGWKSWVSLWCLTGLDMVWDMAGLLWRHSVSKDLGMSVLRGGDGTAALQPYPCLMIGKHAERNWVTTLGVVGSLTDTHISSPPRRINMPSHLFFHQSDSPPPGLKLASHCDTNVPSWLAYTCPPVVTETVLNHQTWFQ